jgi:ribonuclease HI
LAGFLIQIDGSSLNNPGPAGIGVRITGTDGNVVKEISHSIGIRTNNQAEYEALICALREAAALGDAPVAIHTDSELLYCQMTGRYRVRHPRLKPLYQQAAELLSRLPNVSLRHVPREENRATDKLARLASARMAEDGKER